MKVISYNLRKNRAVTELAGLINRYGPDIVCLQECETGALPKRIAGLALSESTQQNRLGLAVYYSENTYRAVAVKTLALKKSMHDRILRPAHERVLGVRLHDIDNGRDVIVASFHAAPLTARNSLRRQQIYAAHEQLATLGDGLPILMVGDYNYPVFKENLSQNIRQHGYDLTLSDSRTYTRYKFFRGHYDFATSIGLDIENVTTLPKGESDHLPILVDAHFRRTREHAQS